MTAPSNRVVATLARSIRGIVASPFGADPFTPDRPKDGLPPHATVDPITTIGTSHRVEGDLVVLHRHRTWPGDERPEMAHGDTVF